ncbi:hypothetical protein [Asaia bogorensis]|uniref:Uncharacterized protein n=1 Tax=Asaia bogorensis NBRC 16594 TaxID=1231624 RepID=A0AAN4R319_9PROT|nr:hypothetical protein [Asaia bogorensis]BAT20511.1 hypothetical protein Asbog_02255 [Asaia bogorensis NBRC 16594]GBQ79086.1 hypothetical protein AA0311_1937 [Asaia bogorensis NBRC 16594]GEL52066.1 hypothetical protein ABO01nite_00730 [Asaia bogorensis NBRC 16594]
MSLAALALVAGWATCLILLAVLSRGASRLTGFFHLNTIFTHSAYAAAIAALWLGSEASHWPHYSGWFLSGFLTAPFCILPICQRLAGKVAGLTRAASGLGAGPRARLRLLWFPLLRGPILLSGLISLATLTSCLILGRFTHV